MTDFRPLRETSTSSFERALLRSADRDEPSPRAFAKTAAAVGVGAAFSSAAANTAAAASSTTSLAMFWTMAAKPLLIGAAGGLVVAVGAHRLSAPSGADSANPGASASEQTPPSVEPRTFADSPANAPLPVAPDGEIARGPSQEVLRGPAPAASTATRDPVSIAREIGTIDRARKALREGRPKNALREIDLYRAGWPNGVFATEAEVLAIEAHLALGDRAQAVRAARVFLATEPSGRYALRVRSLFLPTEVDP
jgi:hypothetical protein